MSTSEEESSGSGPWEQISLNIVLKNQGEVIASERKQSTGMADTAVMQPKGMVRPKKWDEEVEEAYRFQLAGYRDAVEYKQIQGDNLDRWPHNNYVKKLVRRDGYFYYYNKSRECEDKDVYKTKMYSY